MKYFQTMIAILGAALFTPQAGAHLTVTIDTLDLNLVEEGFRFSGENEGDYYYLDYNISNYFDFNNAKLETTFIIPETFFSSIDENISYIDNPVINVAAPKLFNSPTIGTSQFSVWLEPFYDGTYLYSWSLILNLTEKDMPHDGVTRRGFLSASGGFDSNLNGWAHYLKVDFYQDDWLYRRASGGPWEVDTHSIFFNWEGKLAIERIAVPEPASPVLFLSGLAGIFILRKIKKRPELQQNYR